MTQKLKRGLLISSKRSWLPSNYKRKIWGYLEFELIPAKEIKKTKWKRSFD